MNRDRWMKLEQSSSTHWDKFLKEDIEGLIDKFIEDQEYELGDLVVLPSEEWKCAAKSVGIITSCTELGKTLIKAVFSCGTPAEQKKATKYIKIMERNEAKMLKLIAKKWTIN